MAGLKVLFVTENSSDDDCSAVRRLLVLKEGLENLGVQTGILYLGDYFLNTPRLILPVNIPHFLKIVGEYEIVHAAGVSSYVMGLAKPFGSFRLVCDVHGSAEESKLIKKGLFDLAGNYQWLVSLVSTKISRKQGDFFITVSEPLRQKMIEEGIDKRRTEVIYNGVNTELFRPCKEKVANETFTVTYAGAFQKWQGIENLVMAAQSLRNAEIKFKIIGFKKTDLLLKDEIRSKLGDRVELIDFLPNQPPELIDHLSRSDVLIIPRYWDPNSESYGNAKYLRDTFGWFPTKFAEYIATGRPIIVTNLDVSSDFVRRNDCGFVCDPTPASIASAILEAKKMPSEELDKKGLRGRQLAEREFDFRVTGKKYLQSLSRMM